MLGKDFPQICCMMEEYYEISVFMGNGAKNSAMSVFFSFMLFFRYLLDAVDCLYSLNCFIAKAHKSFLYVQIDH